MSGYILGQDPVQFTVYQLKPNHTSSEFAWSAKTLGRRTDYSRTLFVGRAFEKVGWRLVLENEMVRGSGGWCRFAASEPEKV